MPQTNDPVEAMNKKILRVLKRKIGEAKGAWLEELPRILWALRATPYTATEEKTFSLVYGTETVIPTEIGITQHFDEGANQEAIRLNLDLVDEFREAAKIKNATHAHQVARYYNSKASFPALHREKMAPSWERPYKVIEKIGYEAYKLAKMEGIVLPRTWNAHHLKNYYE
ncbi:Integrase, catalytic core [Gossypium australe]|uniref:Integrase, catalytic core n=1 Tax=Gossypium australe TaxID=47621 RepID=A0A5B6VBJ1_9ROSI|nr:Integrase, catalytic core [Gossypium australe]